ncbi:GntR family transcriptional regulator [Paenibacillus sp. KS-LC4]|uniref:GntR family transcriptional regulator n=1 Tax=Paenibacillus sp. KS-LC4 TaxID=2979727 RepID=UPI0030D3311F
MQHRRLVLRVDPTLTFNVNTQIKEQFKWLIGTGDMQAGDMLPPAGELAEFLGLNRNTINWVYSQLKEEGLVSVQKGRGTQVIAGPEVDRLQQERIPMKKMLTHAQKEAVRNQVSLKQYFQAGLAYTLMLETDSTRPQRLLFVECKGHDHLFYSREISRLTGADVERCFLEDIRSESGSLNEAVSRADAVVTTLNHAEEVKQMLQPFGKKLTVIGAIIEQASLLEIAKLPTATSLAFVCLGKVGGEWMAERVLEAGVKLSHCTAAGTEDSLLLSKVLTETERVYASAAVYEHLKQITPGNNVHLYPMQLEKSSELLLQELAAIKSIS